MTTIAGRAKNVSPSLTLEITAKAKKMKEEGIEVISFGAGEPDFNTPDYIVAAAKRALDQGMTKYTPAGGTVALRKAIAKKLKKDNGLEYDYTQIVVSNGAKHALYNAFLALLDPGDEVILPAPYWLTYPELIKLCDGVPAVLPARAGNGFKLTPKELQAAITPRTKALVLNNPSNPTGAVYTKAELSALAEVIEKTDIVVVADEIYEKLIYDGLEAYSIAAFSPKLQDRTILVNGVSKSYSMTGWRIGYTASNPALAKAMGSMQSHMTSNPNSIAQYASVEALEGAEGEAFLAQMTRTFDERRKYITGRLEGMKPLTYIPPQGAFYVMVGVSGLFGKSSRGKVLASAMDAATALLDGYDVAAIPCESFGAPEYLRLSYAVSLEDIAKGLDRIERFVSELE